MFYILKETELSPFILFPSFCRPFSQFIPHFLRLGWLPFHHQNHSLRFLLVAISSRINFLPILLFIIFLKYCRLLLCCLPCSLFFYCLFSIYCCCFFFFPTPPNDVAVGQRCFVQCCAALTGQQQPLLAAPSPLLTSPCFGRLSRTPTPSPSPPGPPLALPAAHSAARSSAVTSCCAQRPMANWAVVEALPSLTPFPPSPGSSP
jgi:hypothetical protein